jgi:hypothetical protein
MFRVKSVIKVFRMIWIELKTVIFIMPYDPFALGQIQFII